eukprot:TRINITY_DN1811_c0_g1_i1.p2 TRINITY_DN1811_c0_g1~~TRINITY_DN1811_c0_g1_i1.p2  ORF type:complete len:153 (+),score=15.91 TRINITY_DN1811_c0_g1_i1:66-524(+)
MFIRTRHILNSCAIAHHFVASQRSKQLNLLQSTLYLSSSSRFFFANQQQTRSEGSSSSSGSRTGSSNPSSADNPSWNLYANVDADCINWKKFAEKPKISLAETAPEELDLKKILRLMRKYMRYVFYVLLRVTYNIAYYYQEYLLLFILYMLL